MLFKNYWGSFGCWWTWAHLSLIFIKVQELQIFLRATQTLGVLIFFKKSFVWCPVWNSPCLTQHRFYRAICLDLIKIIFTPEAITWVSRKWTDADGVHYWRIYRSSYRKLVWVGFEPTTTEFSLDAKADWVIRPLHM